MKAALKKITILISSFVVMFLVACENPGGSTIGETHSIGTSAVQKGPFVSGSAVTIQELDERFDPTGRTYNTQISNDFGEFRLGSTITSNYVEVIAKGFYFNEVSGSLSDAELTLRSIVDLRDVNNQVNVNILTTLAKDRIIKLVVEDGMSFANAKKQAELEVLTAFNISATEESESFESMDLSKPGESNAILLAVSTILQANNSVAQLSELISRLSNDIRINGAIANDLNRNQISQQSQIFTASAMSQVRTNLANRYTNLGISVSIPEFETAIAAIIGQSAIRGKQPAQNGTVNPGLLDTGDYQLDPSFPILFSWDSVPEATEYEIQISANAATLSEAVIQSVDTNTFTLPNVRYLNRSLHWRVRSISSEGVAGPWSLMFTFNVSPELGWIYQLDKNDKIRYAEKPTQSSYNFRLSAYNARTANDNRNEIDGYPFKVVVGL